MFDAMLILAGAALLAGVALYRLELDWRGRWAVQAPQRAGWRLSRQAGGLLAGAALAALGLGMIPAFNLQGGPRLMALIGAAGLGVGFGLALPRAPLVREQRLRRAIRLALPAAMTQWRIGLQSGDRLIQVLERYAAIPRPERAPIQAVIRQARQALEDGRTRPELDRASGAVRPVRLLFAEALLEAARRTGCPELVNVCAILAHADAYGGVATAIPALIRESDLLARTVGHEMDEMMNKRGLALIAAAAPSVVGAVILILFIAAAGGTISF